MRLHCWWDGLHKRQGHRQERFLRSAQEQLRNICWPCCSRQSLMRTDWSISILWSISKYIRFLRSIIILIFLNIRSMQWGFFRLCCRVCCFFLSCWIWPHFVATDMVQNLADREVQRNYGENSGRLPGVKKEGSGRKKALFRTAWYGMRVSKVFWRTGQCGCAWQYCMEQFFSEEVWWYGTAWKKNTINIIWPKDRENWRRRNWKLLRMKRNDMMTFIPWPRSSADWAVRRSAAGRRKYSISTVGSWEHMNRFSMWWKITGQQERTNSSWSMKVDMSSCLERFPWKEGWSESCFVFLWQYTVLQDFLGWNMTWRWWIFCRVRRKDGEHFCG